ncbi:MAG: nucleoside triphosphate pyrophosphohydrolase [Bacteroidetes bacterium]|nr:MAG: nucleoside triphosphate pyrophosphohydrolase [Bacteroidota bacterium]
MNEKLVAFDRLLTIMDELREKCPWDKKQTIGSIRHLTIEETYELSDAILTQDMEKIKKELGDLLLHIVFYSRIASETNTFNIADVCNSLCEKLIHRHPHIYGDVKVKDEHEVKSNWEKLKLKEKDASGKMENTSALGGVPTSLPAMIKAHRIQEKARGVGFDWEKPEQVWRKVQEELRELRVELDSLSKGEGRGEAVEDEFGDLLFALINYARFINVNPEDALEKTNRKFIKRFQYLEKESAKDGKQLGNMTLSEMDEYWNRAKKL